MSLAPRVMTSPFAFLEWNNLQNVNPPGTPRSTWRPVEPFTYAHQSFVPEIAEDMFR
ncbi:hypothetical protein Afil01_67590 [Actinorhabdospora filicis]|uniref:Uncharacterized protein n=1 Tax=Actinorhabdospora filicis TaxID=1785913 RepID=A0A9W6W6V2_9ACTN|nr:hypothetical protein [Actinorhabdospora filicis]GLZ81952.1 hypothetical protein Afil01_67590 [Actinorhabdospora filicis]